MVYQSGQLIILFSDWLIQEVDLERLFSNVLVEVELNLFLLELVELFRQH